MRSISTSYEELHFFYIVTYLILSIEHLKIIFLIQIKILHSNG